MLKLFHIWKQILPLLTELLLLFFFAFLLFGLWDFFTSERKSGSIALIIIVIIGSSVSGFIVNRKNKKLNPYIISGTVKEFGFNSAHKNWSFTLNGKEAIEILKDGSTKKYIKPKSDYFKDNEYFYRALEKKDNVSNQDPMTPYFYAIYDNLKEGQEIEILVIPKENPLGFIVDGKLNIIATP